MTVPVTINVNQLSLVHQGSGGISIATLPDVCLTPAPPAPPVPVPYPNVALSADLAQGTTTVFADGGNSCAISPSMFATSVGDEPGVIGGVMSGTFSMDASWLTFSADVKIEGQAACRLTDKMLMNHGNTLCCEGVQNPTVFGEVKDFVVWLYIKKFMYGNNVCEAFQAAEKARNGDGKDVPPNCYDVNLAAAEHYLYVRCEISKKQAEGHGATLEALKDMVLIDGYEDLKRALYTAGFVAGLPFELFGVSGDPSSFLGELFVQILAASNWDSSEFKCPVSPPSPAQVKWAQKGVLDQLAGR